MLASHPAKRLVHSICVIASAAIVCTLFSRPIRRQAMQRQASIDLTHVRRLQLWGQWLAAPAVN